MHTHASWVLAVLASLTLGCVSVGDLVQQGQQSAARGDIKGARASYERALTRARSQIAHEHYVHLEYPLWIELADACVAYGTFLDRTEGPASRDHLFDLCLDYTATRAHTRFLAVSAAGRVEEAWSRASRDRRAFPAALAHGLVAAAMQSTRERPDSSVLVDQRDRIQASTRDMFFAMSAGAQSWAADRQASAAVGSAPSNDADRRIPQAAAAAARQRAIAASAGGGAAAGSHDYFELLRAIPALDRAIGARIALSAYPSLTQYEPARALLAAAAQVESSARARDPAAVDAAFDQALAELYGWLAGMPGAGCFWGCPAR